MLLILGCCEYVIKSVLPILALLTLVACGSGGNDGGGGLAGISLNARATSETTIELSWSRPRDGYQVSPYVVARDDDMSRRAIGSTTERKYLVAGLFANTRFCFILKNPITGNTISDRACATTAADQTAPSVPTDVSATSVSPLVIELSWRASSDAGIGGGYNIFRDTTLIATITGVRYSDDTVLPGVGYCYRVSAFDLSENQSAQSNESCATTALDTESPSTPENVSVDYINNAGSPTMRVGWAPSSDNSRIDHYTVTRDGVEIGNVADASFDDTNILGSSTYCYSVVAVDIAGNLSGSSEEVCARSSWRRQALGISYPGAAVIALDSAGTPRVAYKDRYFDSSQSEYRSRLNIGTIGDTFTPELLSDSVAESYVSGEYSMDMVLGADDVANILHQSVPGPGSEQLDHVTRSDSTTAQLAIQTSIVYLQDVSVAIDQAGVLHACVKFDNTIFYVENSTGTWSLTELDSLGGDSKGSDCSITVASDGSVHMAYLAFLQEDLWYLSNQSGAWAAELIDEQSGTGTDIAYHTAILVDASGFAHIAYAHDYAENDLEYASNSSGSWAFEKVDDSGTVGYRSDMIIDSLDQVSIFYEQIDAGSLQLRHASRDTGDWESYQLGSSTTGPLSADIDPDDKVHIVYTDQGGELVYLSSE